MDVKKIRAYLTLDSRSFIKLVGVLGSICAFVLVEVLVIMVAFGSPHPEVECTTEDKVAIVFDKEALAVSDIQEEPKVTTTDQKTQPPVSTKQKTKSNTASKNTRTGKTNSFKSDGVWRDGNYRYTWYSSKVLRHYRTSEWTAGSDGIYRDTDGYVVVASSDHPIGTVIGSTPFGSVKVYDSGCASGTLDVYTNF